MWKKYKCQEVLALAKRSLAGLLPSPALHFPHPEPPTLSSSLAWLLPPLVSISSISLHSLDMCLFHLLIRSPSAAGKSSRLGSILSEKCGEATENPAMACGARSRHRESGLIRWGAGWSRSTQQPLGVSGAGWEFLGD